MFDKWDAAFMETAFRFAELSSAKRLKCGAIIVKDKRIISIGYNGMPPGWSNECEDAEGNTKPEVLHAEENAISKLAASTESANGSTLYVTHNPCPRCAKLIQASGIKKVIYRDKYRLNDSITFLEACNVEVQRFTCK
jgi:dCMP deaminase